MYLFIKDGILYIKLCIFSPFFNNQEVDLEVLLDLKDDDLIDIGVNEEHDRNKILSFVKKFKKR